MKEIYVLLAEYNAHANGLLFGVLEKAPAGLVTKDAGSFFGSILGLLNHILRSDLGWLSRIGSSQPGLRSLAGVAASFDPATAPRQLCDNLADLWKRRREVDGAFGAFAAELSDGVLKGDVRFVNSKGEQESFVIGEILLHLFNHQTHHRGQVSQILDAAGIQHDFSNISSVLRLRRSKSRP